ncbi:MAG: glutamine--tRNA ligase/YqeY domain fusion protein [Phycisphaeraceae bacterium]|nr:glutamine--tRNA ligase/YqeY domain fusion protein [Phycisphaerales bacterium]QOJ16444.1 MAG: glutamine--tRNA ligase/YqeY domain fusion protein [Phycisphaeraceae bacterium]
MTTAEPISKTNFIREIIDADLASGKRTQVVTRFPPEPNGYLHIGHAKSICLNFGLARDYAGVASGGARCHLRFDDTNPTKEEQEYIDSIKRDIRWLGFDWGAHEYYASDYFEQLYEWAIVLIRKGLAYVCDLSAEQVAATRGTPTIPATPSPYRDRSVEENLDLFRRMRAGEFPNGARTLRAKIDLASPNFNLRDPVLYRILHHPHPRTGDAWCIYPMYDYAHGQSDAIEGITHSICTLEFEDHRPLYDWFITNIGITHHPQQIEFARLNITHTLMSKRKLLTLVEEGIVRGWDDPRMPTLAAARRRGVPPEALRDLCDGVGVAKREHVIELARLEHHIRERLNRTASRRMAVLRPLKLVITNYPEGQVEYLPCINNPEDPAAGTRDVPFSRELFIERDDFAQVPPPKFHRLSPGAEVRLRSAYWVKCHEVIKNPAGEITEVRCTFDPATRGGESPPDGRKVKATLHWVSAAHAIPAEVRLYEPLFSTEDPNDDTDGRTWKDNINPKSLEVIDPAWVEPSLAAAVSRQPSAVSQSEPSPPGRGQGEGASLPTYQFERLGYFCLDPDTTAKKLVFNRTVTLKDSFGKSR